MARKKQTPARSAGEQSDTPSQGVAEAPQTTEVPSGESSQASTIEPDPQQAITTGVSVGSAPEVGTANPVSLGTSSADLKQGLSSGDSTGDETVSEDAAGAEAGSTGESPEAGKPAVANPNPVNLVIYPLRSYMDEGELRRRSGAGYSVPRRHAEQLVQKGLASLEPLEE
ncbi:hypothetical protein [Pseudomonas cremoricolorata]|uniref:hypothetical protein n=1 Tax=Pseudomonas cremoricolorata TaxID=157783 RepID=UPI000571605B|nr:hypothetical protein [Pseudomonas cremoricolorata]